MTYLYPTFPCLGGRQCISCFFSLSSIVNAFSVSVFSGLDIIFSGKILINSISELKGISPEWFLLKEPCQFAQGIGRPVFKKGLSCSRRAQSACLLSTLSGGWATSIHANWRLPLGVGAFPSPGAPAVCSPAGGERLSERHGECVGGRDGQEADGVLSDGGPASGVDCHVPG